jgi:hypothetical protein
MKKKNKKTNGLRERERERERENEWRNKYDEKAGWITRKKWIWGVKKDTGVGVGEVKYIMNKRDLKDMRL